MITMLGISLAKMLCLSYSLIIAYFYSSTELNRSAEQVLPEREGGGEKGWGVEAGGRNAPNNVYTCE
jgi:hypothetical protein